MSENPPEKYTIKKGDNLTKIIKRFNPNLSRQEIWAAYSTIQQANQEIIHDINKIRIGDIISIPESIKSGIKQETRGGLNQLKTRITHPKTREKTREKTKPKPPVVEIPAAGIKERQQENPRNMPSTTQAMALFFSDAFKKGPLGRANRAMRGRQDPYARAYQELATAATEIENRQENWHELFENLIPDGLDLTTRSPIWHKQGDLSLPKKEGLQRAHGDALDIFFTHSEKQGNVEIGPQLCAVSAGIVTAARGDWQGGIGEKSYRKGGLSPKAGNGVIIYNPNSREYFYYAHMHTVIVKTGDVVRAGQIIGQGGNTGIKARKPGRGGHVHFEIHKTNPSGTTRAHSSHNLYAQIDRSFMG